MTTSFLSQFECYFFNQFVLSMNYILQNDDARKYTN